MVAVLTASNFNECLTLHPFIAFIVQQGIEEKRFRLQPFFCSATRDLVGTFAVTLTYVPFAGRNCPKELPHNSRNERCSPPCIFYTSRALDTTRVLLHGVIEQNGRGARGETAETVNSENVTRNTRECKERIPQERKRKGGRKEERRVVEKEKEDLVAGPSCGKRDLGLLLAEFAVTNCRLHEILSLS